MSNQVEFTEAETIHMKFIQKNGLPTVQRVAQMKQATEKKIMGANATGGEDRDALDLLSVLNEWLMIRTDKRLMEAFTKIAAGDVIGARMASGKGMN